MIIAKNSQQLESSRSSLGGSVALVPTMGNLHKGHLSLVEKAKSEAESVIVTIYVNPLQFSKNEDLDSYPRTLETDIKKLEELDVDLLFMPDDTVIYPDGMENHTQVVVPKLSFLHCGAFREGHFIGVTTVVCKLFNLIRPDVAIFGDKDYQQLALIRKMVSDLAMPVKIVGVATHREESGLAMSSRNQYLTLEERLEAATLFDRLKWAKQQLESGNNDFTGIENKAKDFITGKKIDVEFFTICDQKNLKPATIDDKNIVILTAVRFGKARLIDNITVDLT